MATTATPRVETTLVDTLVDTNVQSDTSVMDANGIDVNGIDVNGMDADGIDANGSNAAPMSLEQFLENPPDRTEWMDDRIITKVEMTAKTGRIQAKLARYWGNYKESSGQGGEVYTETACRTVGRVRCPDVAYLLPDQVTEFGDFKVLPHSFPLIAEVISPTDEAEEVFTKVREYLESNGQEIWLLFPESQWLMTITAASQKLFGMDDTVTSPLVLPGLTIAVGELMA